MEEWLNAERITITTMLAGIIISGARKMWVWGYQVEGLETRLKEADTRAVRWENIALRALKAGEIATNTQEERNVG